MIEAAFLAGYNPAAFTLACLLPSIGVVAYLFAPFDLGPGHRHEATEEGADEKVRVQELTRSASMADLQNRGRNCRRSFSRWLNSLVPGDDLRDWIKTAAAKLMQASVGVTALLTLYALAGEIGKKPWVTIYIAGFCTLFQLIDNVVWICTEQLRVEYMSNHVVAFRAKQHAFEENCKTGGNGFLAVGSRLSHLYSRVGADSRESAAQPYAWPRRFLLSRMNGLGQLVRASPIKITVAMLNIIVAIDGFSFKKFVLMLSSFANVDFPGMDVIPALGADAWEWLSGPVMNPAAYVWEASLGDYRNATHPTRCLEGQPCMMLGESGRRCTDWHDPSGSGSPAIGTWTPTSTESIKLKYPGHIRVTEVHVHYRFVTRLGADGTRKHSPQPNGVQSLDPALREPRGGQNAFSLQLQINGQPFAVGVVHERPSSPSSLLTSEISKRNVSVAPLMDRVVDYPILVSSWDTKRAWPTPSIRTRWSHLRNQAVRDVNEIFWQTRSSSRLASCPDVPLRLAVVREDARSRVPVISNQLSIGLRSATGASVEIDAVYMLGKGVPKSTITQDENGLEVAKEEDEIEGVAGLDEEEEEVEFNTEDDDYKEEEGGGGGGGGGGGFQVPIGEAAALASAGATVAATTDFVRKRTKPAEYQKDKEREMEKRVLKNRKEEALAKLRLALVLPMDVLIAERALTQAIDAEVEMTVTTQARREIDDFIYIERTKVASMHLKQAVQTALQTKSLVWIRSGKSSSGPTGTAAHVLQQAESELSAALEESKRVGLKPEAIEVARKVLNRLREYIQTAIPDAESGGGDKTDSSGSSSPGSFTKGGKGRADQV